MIAGQREPLRFFSIALNELLSMSPAEVDYLDSLPSEEREAWFRLWQSVQYQEARS